MSTRVLTFSILCLTSAVFADDFKTISGKEYKEATVTRVEPDGIVVRVKSGISKLYFTELPKDVQEKFHYDPQRATAYSVEQAANYAAYQQQQQKQQEEGQRLQEDVAAKNKVISAGQQAAANRTEALQTRYNELQQQEDALLQQIGEAKKPGTSQVIGRHHFHYENPRRSELPLLKSHLEDVRHEKNQVRKQLESGQQ